MCDGGLQKRETYCNVVFLKEDTIILEIDSCHETSKLFSLDLWIVALSSSLLSINIASWAALFEKVINSKCPLLD